VRYFIVNSCGCDTDRVSQSWSQRTQLRRCTTSLSGATHHDTYASPRYLKHYRSLAYVVTLAGHQISTDLHVTNTGSEAFEVIIFVPTIARPILIFNSSKRYFTHISKLLRPK
jgi:hypothetical protein